MRATPQPSSWWSVGSWRGPPGAAVAGVPGQGGDGARPPPPRWRPHPSRARLVAATAQCPHSLKSIAPGELSIPIPLLRSFRCRPLICVGTPASRSPTSWCRVAPARVPRMACGGPTAVAHAPRATPPAGLMAEPAFGRHFCPLPTHTAVQVYASVFPSHLFLCLPFVF